jgi:hypothetical protein
MNDTIQFSTRQNDDMLEVMRITRDGVFANPDVAVDDVAKAVLDALSSQIKTLVQKAVEDEREACAKVCEQPIDEIQITDDRSELWYMDGMECAEAIRARGEK